MIEHYRDEVVARRLEAYDEETGFVHGVWEIKPGTEETFGWALGCAVKWHPGRKYRLVTTSEFSEPVVVPGGLRKKEQTDE